MKARARGDRCIASQVVSLQQQVLCHASKPAFRSHWEATCMCEQGVLSESQLPCAHALLTALTSRFPLVSRKIERGENF